MEQFYCKTKILTGDAAQALASLRPEKLLLVADPFFVKNGTAQRLAQASGAAQTEIFSQVEPDPTVELAAKGTAVVKAFAPDTVVALGGGSAMDLTKAMTFFYDGQVRLVAIPTTSGSGSEVTDFSVLTHGTVKYPLTDRKLQPHVAILDSALLEKLPKSLIADTGFDVLSHALEALVATGAGAITDALAREAFHMAFVHLPDSYAGKVQVREKVHAAATMAGMAFTQAGLGLCHAMAHSLGGMFHLPHGRLNAILLPSVVACNATVAGEKYARLARSMGFSGAADTVAVRNLKNALVRLRRELGLPEDLKKAGLDIRQVRSRIPEIVGAVLEDPCCKTNPVPVEESLVRRILDEVIGHG